MAWSRHTGFFASLERVEDRLALEEEEQQEKSVDGTMTEQQSPLVFLDHYPTTAAATTAGSSGPALDFLTLTRQQTQETDTDQEEDDDDIERLMALLGLSPPQDVHGGCDCSGADGFLGKVVGVVGPKCEGEKTRLDAWIHHFYSSDGGCREPARLAHLLLAMFSDGQAFFPATVKEFLDRDAPSTTTD